MRFPILINKDNPELNYTKICLSALRRVPASIRSELKNSNRWEDIVLWAFCAALESQRKSLDASKAYNLAQREIYQALKAEGFRKVRKGKRMIWRATEITQSDINSFNNN